MNNKNQPMGYEIEFLGANNEPLAYCKAEMSINGLPTSEYPWQADENGRIVFPPSLVEQEGKELRIKVVFWNEQYPKTEHSEIPEFTWIKGKRLVRLRAYNIYEITPRTIPNEKGEPETYKRPYHVVKKGDTWESIEKEAGVSQYALFSGTGIDFFLLSIDLLLVDALLSDCLDSELGVVFVDVCLVVVFCFLVPFGK